MIEIELYTREGIFTGLKSSGHASLDLGNRGSNPLCAGVSVLLQTLFLYLNKQKLVEKVVKQDGLLAFHLVEIRNPKLTITIDQAFQMVIVGLEELVKEHPEEVRIKLVEEIIKETSSVS
ncbi:MAG: ribosomal-processing cysteine protease Prp [Leptospira sp.]|nr:ribosomal-processing cysteine protease Prp [Leptospira sp.]